MMFGLLIIRKELNYCLIYDIIFNQHILYILNFN